MSAWQCKQETRGINRILGMTQDALSATASENLNRSVRNWGDPRGRPAVFASKSGRFGDAPAQGRACE